MENLFKKLSCRRSLSNEGFTLVEILATFVLIAIILPVAMEGLSLSTRMASKARRQIEAGALAEIKLTEVLITQEWINGDQEGDFGDEYPDYGWRIEVLDWEEEESMQQINLHVEWIASEEVHSVVITTLAYSEGD